MYSSGIVVCIPMELAVPIKMCLIRPYKEGHVGE
jgi:hypothetical protein